MKPTAMMIAVLAMAAASFTRPAVGQETGIRPGLIWSGERVSAPTNGGELRNGVALEGNVAAIGAPGEAQSVGAVHMYERQASGWIETQTLTPSQPVIQGLFGATLALQGDRLAVGESNHVNGAFRAPGELQPMGGGSFSEGAVYLFERQQGQWVEIERLTASDGADGAIHTPEGTTFGTALAMDGQTVAVGAFGHTPENGLHQQGAVYVYTDDGSGWREVQKLTPDDARAGDRFGNAVALRGDTLLVGARDATRDRALPSHGAVYVFKREGGQWVQRQRLLPPTLDSRIQFGYSLALEGDTALVGAPRLGEPYNIPEFGFGRGAAYVLNRSGDTWRVSQELPSLAVTEGTHDVLGWSLALSGDLALVSAWQTTFTDGLVQQGTAHVYERAGDRWYPQSRLTSPAAADYTFFGAFVALSGRTALTGNFSAGGDVFMFDAIRPPTAQLAAGAVQAAVPPDGQVQKTVRLDNLGDLQLDFQVDAAAARTAMPAAKTAGAKAWQSTDRPQAGLLAQPANGLRAPHVQGAAPLDFVLDDGQAEESMTLRRDHHEQSTVWLNRFAAPSGTGAFTIDSLSVLFPVQSSGTLVGKAVTLVAYYDADSDGNPSNAVRLTGEGEVTIGAEGQLETFPTDFRVPGDGDIYVGFETRYARGGGYPLFHPVAVDTSAPRFAHSWFGSMEAGAAVLDDLSANRVQGFLEDYTRGGNWVIRATGSAPANDCIAPSAPAWLDVVTTSGAVAAHGHSEIQLLINAQGLAEGTHQAQLCVASNDPSRAMQRVPVRLSVRGADFIFADGFGDSP